MIQNVYFYTLPGEYLAQAYRCRASTIASQPKQHDHCIIEMMKSAFVSSLPIWLKGKQRTWLSTKPSLSVTPKPRRTQVHRMSGSIIPSANGGQKTPAETFQAAVTLGASKARLAAWKVILMSILGGAYIAMGALLSLTVGGALPALQASNPGLQKLILGLIGLPLGLTLVCITGAELFTGNTALVTTAVLEGKASVAALLKNWMWSYIGNFLGSLGVVAAVLGAGCLGGAAAKTAVSVATAKVSLGFWRAFLRGVLCNWLVCLAVYVQNGATALSEKIVAIMFPVAAFVAIGLDHSVANMFLIPIGMRMGADVSVKQFLVANLLPATLGNVVGGVVLVAVAFWLAFGTGINAFKSK